MDNLIPSREEMLTSLSEKVYDIIVVGGGITGAGVARDATLRGLKVALIEKNDFASGTSSMTSKMLHGGLRYLKNYEFRLVRKAALERKIHLDIAPHLAEVMELLVPLYNWNEDSPFKLRLGLMLYDLLAFPKQIGKHKNMKAKDLIALMPQLENDEIRAGALYHDVKTNDARLTLANCLSAAAGGADTVNYVEMRSWETGDGEVVVDAIDTLTDTELTITAKYIILCAGPWSQIVESKGKDFDGEARVRLTRGTHVILKRKLDKYACLMMNEDNRPIFLMPGLDYDLAGTTDLDHEGTPDDVKPTKEEVEYLINACNKLFPTAGYKMEDVKAAFAGVRPLVYKEGDKPGDVSREHSIFQDKTNRTVTIVGGKLTTYRIMGKQALDKVMRHMGLVKVKCLTDKLPLWGGEVEDWGVFYPNKTKELVDEFSLSESTAKMLVQWYGSEIDFFKEYLVKHGTQKLHDKQVWLEAQIYYACQVELALTPIDLMRRRLSMMFEDNNGLGLVDKVVAIMSEELNWDDKTKISMNNRTKDYIEKYIRVTN